MGGTDKTEFIKIKNICSLKVISKKNKKIGYILRAILYVLYTYNM